MNIVYSKSDFLCCTETWLDSRYPDNILNIDDMKIFRRDRVDNISTYDNRNVGGGVYIYVSNRWKDYTTCLEPC